MFKLHLSLLPLQLLYVSCSYHALVSAESPASLAAIYALTTSTSLPFPSATLAPSASDSFMVSSWSLSKGRVEDGPQNVAFVSDPFPQAPVPGPSDDKNLTGPVLRVTYAAGNFSSAGSGAQFYSLWNTTDGSTFQSMLLSYEVAFDSGFDWVKGGKLPGIRGGPDPDGCSGGDKPNGTDCFSTRLMWRKFGDGEVYSYIPTPNKLCDAPGIRCNDDFGTSIQRGSYSFPSGKWSRISLVVRLNNPPNMANGFIGLYFNDVEAITQSDLQLRSSASVNANGLYFSTFFGGGDKSWAPSAETHSYYRNFHLWGSPAPSNLTGSKVTSGAPSPEHAAGWWSAVSVTVLALLGVAMA